MCTDPVAVEGTLWGYTLGDTRAHDQVDMDPGRASFAKGRLAERWFMEGKVLAPGPSYTHILVLMRLGCLPHLNACLTGQRSRVRIQPLEWLC